MPVDLGHRYIVNGWYPKAMKVCDEIPEKEQDFHEPHRDELDRPPPLGIFKLVAAQVILQSPAQRWLGLRVQGDRRFLLVPLRLFNAALESGEVCLVLDDEEEDDDA